MSTRSHPQVFRLGTLAARAWFCVASTTLLQVAPPAAAAPGPSAPHGPTAERTFAAADVCPTNRICDRYTNAPTDTVNGSYSGAGYDCIQGTAFAGCGVPNGGNAGCSADVSDGFILQGPGTAAITFTVRVMAKGTISSGCQEFCGRANAGGTVSVISGPSVGFSENSNGGTRTLDRELSMVVTYAPGERFNLRTTIGASVDIQGYAFLTLAFSFPDLPHGYALFSCQGFSAGDAVATRLDSWGRLKSIYR